MATAKQKAASRRNLEKARAARQKGTKPTPKLAFRGVNAKVIGKGREMPSQITRASGKLLSGERPTSKDLDWIHSNLKSKTLRGKPARQGRRVLREFERRSRLRIGWK
ncbi:hypothetical protein SEND513_9 [Mycobacterium phage Send513]|uniref:Uncharacterized protein n=4 Tax=Papyrusvirus send513 TaxID=1982556 RepID=A0A0Y0A6S0_9CAUD|nr:hypothetical protein FDI62_gp09 [Mycobacterium phage Send513]AEK07455.1 hypothetical protein SEND513_9 [Mycobacterium phage Send513]AMB17223.1 hypothetical protein SEA_WEISS13_9 [Mycobacterium phage Weiss13]ARW57095.1 hypothetical protein SEA_ZENON_10 [Mycobacterium phage Zenon]QCG78116.1 hypothetical protein SEA_CANDLE_9 [Mycobacterium phage Candle]